MEDTHQITELLHAWSEGDSQALAQLAPLVDHELRKIAHQRMLAERANHLLQTTALVNEVFLKLLEEKKLSVQNRKHFYGLVARRMRQILVDYARKQTATKRGNRPEHVDADLIVVLSPEKSEELLMLDEALTRLAQINERQAKVVEHRHFGGYTIPEIAELLDCSDTTVERDWREARAWLKREIDSNRATS